MTFQVIPIDYVPKSDIEDFFKRANEQGFYRHTSIDVFNHYDRELKSRIWFTYHEGRPMAVLGAHTLFPRREYFGINAYNILDKLAVLDYNRKFFTPRQFH